MKMRMEINNQIQEYKESELGLLPESWKLAKLGNYCKLLGGFAFKSEDYSKDGILIVKIGNLQNGTIELNKESTFFPQIKINESLRKFALKEGDVLIALTGATTGKTAIVPKIFENSLLNQRVGKFEIFDNRLDYLFTRFYVSTEYFQKGIQNNILQSAQGNVSPKQIENLPIPLLPLPEQQKIAHVLFAIQEAIEKTQTLVNALKELKKSLMNHLFTYGPVSLDETENIKLKDTEIGKILEEWDVMELKNMLTKIQYGLSIRAEKEGEYPILGMNHLKAGKIEASSIKYINLDNNIFEKFKVDKRDLLFNRTNSIDLVGKTSIFNLEGDFVFASYLIRLKFDTSFTSPEFINYYFNREDVQKELKKFASRGVSQSNISASKLKTFKILCPPLSVQDKIASILAGVDEKIEKVENKKEALEELFKSMLHNLMTAKIRVNDLEIKNE